MLSDEMRKPYILKNLRMYFAVDIKYKFKFMLSDEKNIPQNMRRISLGAENDFSSYRY